MLTYQKITLICPQKVQSFFIEHGYAAQRRIAFEFVGLNDQISEIICPEGYNLQLIDSIDIFKRCMWFKTIWVLWGSPNNFMNNSLGSVLINAEGKIVAEAYVAWIGGDLSEIGVITHPNFYGRGFGTIVTKHLIHECLKRNLIPCWSCNRDNKASIKLALKSGFKVKTYYNWLIKKTIQNRFLHDIFPDLLDL